MNIYKYTMLCLIILVAVVAETDKYRLIWNNDPATTMTVAWNQVNGTDYQVYYRQKKGSSQWKTHAPDREIQYREMENKFARLKGLKANTEYLFQIRDSNSQSKIMYFKTAPNSPMPFTFIAGGDSRTNAEPRQHGNKLIAKIRPLFIAHGGDYLNDGTSDEWHMWLDEWQETCSDDGRMYPIIATHGNHENDDRYMMYNIFDIPHKDAYYAFNIAGNLLRLYTLNTELEPEVGYGAFGGQDATKWNEQNVWFEEDLKNNHDKVKWKIINYHRPLRPHTSRKSEGLGRIAAWAQLFYDYGMDLAVECDTHMVKYTYPLRPSEEQGSYESFVRDDEKGTVFIGEGSWGAPTRPTDDDKPWTLASDSFWQYKLIHINEKNIAIRTVKFGKLEELKKDIHYDPTAVEALTQEQQDANPFAMPEGLDLWRPFSKEVLQIPFNENNIENKNYVPTKSSWKHSVPNEQNANLWNQGSFEDAHWNESVTNELPKEKLLYLRKKFAISGDTYRILNANIRVLCDDGVIIYLNGNEVKRYNVSNDENPSAILKIQNPKYINIPVPIHFFQEGKNCIAIALYQKETQDLKIAFDLDLTTTISLKKEIVALPMPENLNVDILSSKEIELSWDKVEGTEYIIERHKESSPWEVLQQKWQTTNYQDAVDSNTNYTYRVRAMNESGFSSNNDITITTPPTPKNVLLEENFANGFGNFTKISVKSKAEWELVTNEDKPCASISGYGSDTNSDDWLVSPEIDLRGYQNPQLTFDCYAKYNGGELSINKTCNYNKSPVDTIWKKLSIELPQEDSRKWTKCKISLGTHNSSRIQIGFHYTSGTKNNEAANWFITNVRIMDGEPQKQKKNTIQQQAESINTLNYKLRIATFNASLYRNSEGQLVKDLSTPHNLQIKNIAETIQIIKPDIILINEFDYVADGSAAKLFRQNYLQVPQNKAQKIEYPYYYIAPSNTGIPSHHDLNNDGTIGGGDDAFGYGIYLGQYSMLILSKYPILQDKIRTFQKFLWQDMPNALLPVDTNTGELWYSKEEMDVFRLSSKNHCDIPIDVNGQTIHVLASHPTPPVFDGEEDRNGKRNHDEIRFWTDYISSENNSYIYDDNSKTGGIDGECFVILGDLNACAVEKDAIKSGINGLLNHSKVNNYEPQSKGAQENNSSPRAPYHTAAWQLRVDYVLPSKNGLKVIDGKVFWPPRTSKYHRLVSSPETSSDHRLVYIDVEVSK